MNKIITIAVTVILTIAVMALCVVPAFIPARVKVEPYRVQAQDPYPAPTHQPTPPEGLEVIKVCGYDTYYVYVCHEFLSDGSPIQEQSVEIGEIVIRR